MPARTANPRSPKESSPGVRKEKPFKEKRPEDVSAFSMKKLLDELTSHGVKTEVRARSWLEYPDGAAAMQICVGAAGFNEK